MSEDRFRTALKSSPVNARWWRASGATRRSYSKARRRPCRADRSRGCSAEQAANHPRLSAVEPSAPDRRLPAHRVASHARKRNRPAGARVLTPRANRGLEEHEKNAPDRPLSHGGGSHVGGGRGSHHGHLLGGERGAAATASPSQPTAAGAGGRARAANPTAVGEIPALQYAIGISRLAGTGKRIRGDGGAAEHLVHPRRTGSAASPGWCASNAEFLRRARDQAGTRTVLRPR